MEDFVRKTKGVRDIKSLPLDTSHELDIVSDVKGKIYIKILNRYKELLFDNGTEPWVTEMLNKLEVDVEQLKEDVLDLEQALTELPIIEDKLEAVETKLAQINTLFAQMQIDVQGLDLRTAELEREVVQLALKDQELLDKINNLDLNVDLDMIYSNSTEFGDYDYNGNPNLLPNFKASDFNTPTGMTAEQVGSAIKFTFDSDGWLSANTGHITALAPNTFYTLSADVTILDSTGGDTDQLRLYIRKENNASLINLIFPAGMKLNEKTKVELTANSSTLYDPSKVEYMFMTFHTTTTNPFKGSVLVENIKLEKAIYAESKATPYQPNLLDAPYYLSKVSLGENIITSKSYDNSNYLTGSFDINKTINNGDKLTFTMQGTKPANKQFGMYIQTTTGAATDFQGYLTPVEGLTDVWSWSSSAKISKPIGSGAKVVIYQLPPESQVPNGKCTISWAKLEEGDTRTPNIPYYNYVGINLEASKNPNDYQWVPLAKSAESVDARLTKTISTYDTVNALQNNRLTALESKVVDTTWQNVSVTEPFTSVTQPQVKKQNGIVYMRGTISNGTGDCFTLPEGFRPPAGAYEMQFRLPCRSANASDYATIYVRPSGLCSIAGVNGTMPIFLSGIIFSTT